MSNTLFGDDANNVLYGGAGNDTIYGQGGNDTLYGQEGNDTLIGGTGADSLIGGNGNDTYVVDNSGDQVIENANEGTDTVVSFISYTLGNNLENLALIGNENINATGNELNNGFLGNDANNVLDGGLGNDSLYGQGGNDTLIGGEGNDYLDGGTGVDSLIGGNGNDTYVVDGLGDVVIENANEGIDAVISSISYTLGDNLETLILTGQNNLNGTGNNLNNTLFGNDVNNVLDGGLGDDTIYGQAGNDTLIGGEGNDTLIGGTGADSLIGGVGNDIYVVDELGDVVIENANEGIDTVVSFISYHLGDHLERLSLIGENNINGAANDLNNAMLGNDGNNFLDGGSGNDNLSGQGGNDTLIGGEGNDTLTGGVGMDAFRFTSLDGGIDTITDFESGTDQIQIDSNGFTGLAIGQLSAEAFTFGAGVTSATSSTHRFIFNTTNGDLFFDADGDGAGASVKIATLSNSASLSHSDIFVNINVTGNDLNNVLLGNDDNNVLDGGIGNDTLYGQGGNDTLVGGVGMDAFRFTSLDGGIDTITDFESGTDKIQIDSSGFTGLAIGQLSAEAFTFGVGVTSATSSTHRFIFNTTNGDLFFDADGDGAGASVKIATLSNSASLSHTDIFVI
ncbi:calcium-binding protein [Sphaerospermopsis torques-reginae]|nr:calcium-binding protein [Sphaerospermopsis torques-reginae]